MLLALRYISAMRSKGIFVHAMMLHLNTPRFNSLPQSTSPSARPLTFTHTLLLLVLCVLRFSFFSPLFVRVSKRARLAHTKRVQGESLKQMKLGQLTSRAGIWLRELVIRSLPPSVLQKKLRAANVFDIDPWLNRFRALKATRRLCD